MTLNSWVSRMLTLQALLLTLLCVLAAKAQIFQPGECPMPPVQRDFDVLKYLGTWYEIEKIPTAFQKGTCSQATYSLGNNGVVNVLNEELLPDGSISFIKGTAQPEDPSEPAKLLVKFFDGLPPGNYWVLSTDYDSYSLVYSCNTSVGLRTEFAWILSRSRTLPAETVSRLRDILRSSGIDADKLTVTEQTDCSAMSR